MPLLNLIDGKWTAKMHEGQQAAWESQKRIVAVIAGGRSGKALALDTPIPTPHGFAAMRDVEVGDTVFDDAGLPCQVVYTSPVMLGNCCYRVTFDDGSSVVADAEHQWVTQTAAQRKNESRRQPMNVAWIERRPQCQAMPDESTVTTEEIRETLLNYRGETNHAIPLALPFQTPDASLPIPPYTLGIWLGDGLSGGASVVTADPAILQEVRADGYMIGKARESNSGQARSYTIGSDKGNRGWDRSNPFRNALIASGLLGNKHIPPAYLFASAPQRMALLQGLMDTDGYCSKGGSSSCEYVTIKKGLADDVLTLIRGLGIKARVATKIPTINGRPCNVAYRVTFTTTTPVFRLARKRDRVPEWTKSDTRRRFIIAVNPVESVAVRCIGVDSPSHQYLCTRSFIPTHNTAWGPLWLHREMIRQGPGDYLVVAPSYQLIDKAAGPEIEHVFGQVLKLGKMTRSPSWQFAFNKTVNLEGWGKLDRPARIIIGHADKPETLEAMRAKAAWLDEAGQGGFKEGSWEAVQQRLANDKGRTLITSKPYNLGWLKRLIYDRWQQSGRNHPEIDVFNFDSRMNPDFPEEEYARARAALPTWRFDMMYRGLFTRPAGVIYEAFDSEIHVVKRRPIPDLWPRYVGVDFGAVNTAAVYFAGELDGQGRPTGRYFIYKTYHPASESKIKVSPAAHVAAIKSGEGMLMAVGGAKSEDEARADFNRAGLYVQEPPIKEVEVGIDRVHAMIQNGKLFIFEGLTDLIDEFSTYSRELNEQGQPTEKIEDKETFHLLDCVRYGCAKLYGGGQDSPISGGRDKATEMPVDAFTAGGLAGRRVADASQERLEQAKLDPFDRWDDDGPGAGGSDYGGVVPDHW